MFLYADNDGLTGEIPECIGTNITNLKEIHDSCNRVTGDIPAGLDEYQYLMEIQARCNQDLSCDYNNTNPNVIVTCDATACNGCKISSITSPEEIEEE